ncbi:MAG TPA: Sua5/YciO/YrdC/YwlC family protein, partial [Kiritimatiellia bacterium]|nr:Sua5/YciO/YrdC/YwlC family protein [Kiritimatiellia bacterium]
MASSADRAGCVPADAAAIRRAADLLRAGALVVVPTETVYGVAARADAPAARAKLYAAKGRDEAKRVAFFAANLAAVRAAGAQVDEIAARLAAAFWPGPLTLVLPNGAGGWDGFR